MIVDVHIYDCYQYTYDKYYEDVAKRCLQHNGITLTATDKLNKVIDVVETSDKSKNNIQAKRSYCSRMIKIVIDGVLRFVVGLSNTNYDEDKRYIGNVRRMLWQRQRNRQSAYHFVWIRKHRTN